MGRGVSEEEEWADGVMWECVGGGGQQRKRGGEGGKLKQLRDVDNVRGTKKSLRREHVGRLEEMGGERTDASRATPAHPSSRPQFRLGRRSEPRVSRFRKENYRFPS